MKVELDIAGNKVEFELFARVEFISARGLLPTLSIGGSSGVVRGALEKIRESKPEFIAAPTGNDRALKINGKTYRWGVVFTQARNGRVWAKAEHFDEMLTEAASKKLRPAVKIVEDLIEEHGDRLVAEAKRKNIDALLAGLREASENINRALGEVA